LAEDRFLVISSATSHPRDKAWIERGFGADEQVVLSDLTGAYAVLSVQGPRSREFLERMTDADLSNDVFPFATSQVVDMGYARVIANRLTYVGELGWELFVPAEFAQDLCDRLLAEGEAVGLVPAGYHALEHLRLERGYREYELDLTPEDTPLEAGLGFTVAFDKPGGFVGRDALLAQKKAGPLTKRLVAFRLKDPGPLLVHDEVIWLANKPVGYVSSGAYGFTLGASVALGYLRHEDGVSAELCAAGGFEIEVAGERYAAEASLRPFYDPEGRRPKA